MALDLSLIEWPTRLAQYPCWWGTGALMCRSARRLDGEPMAFFAGNLAWMSATADLLYTDAPTRLCVNYLLPDQQVTGGGLVVIAVLLGVLALVRWIAGSRALHTDSSGANGASGSRRC